jgi:uncharacterized protein YqgC (DUF456 family)
LLLNFGVEFSATYWGAKQVGSKQVGTDWLYSRFDIWGFGLACLTYWGPLLGILLGPLVGAIIGEFLYRRELELADRAKLSLQAGIGIVVGSLVGKLIQGLLALVVLAVFLFTTWPTMSGV